MSFRPPSARSSFQGSRPVSARSDRSSRSSRASFSFRKGSFTDKPGDMKDAERCASLIRKAAKTHGQILDKLDDYDPGLDGRVSKYGPRRPHRRASAPEARERQRLFDHSPESACRVFRRRNEELVAANQMLETANEKLREENDKLRTENAKLRDYMNNRFI